ncbi:ATP/GTP-binding protein [Streptomyces puniciscabiei]|uniref:ATP/GTP-binding protein n=1 Tax=Streptomyces puniciscabiei TaxID=164348 RepID=UPI003330F05D
MLRSTFAAIAVIGALALSASPSAAEPQPHPSSGVNNCDTGWVCVETGTSGSGGKKKDSKSSAPTGTRQCTKDGKVLPCYDPDLGSFSNGCYYKQVTDPALIADLEKAGKAAGQGNGSVPYEMTCLLDGPNPGSVYVFLKNPPAGFVDPAALAHQAVDKMLLKGPDIASPRAAGKYVVGMPMWMWVDQTQTTYGPNTATASAGGVTVSATAEVSSISWDMGDGTAAVVCNGPGTKYTPSMGKAQSPDCGHVYDKASTDEAGGKFHGTATATWTVNWQVTGGPPDTGSFTEVRRSQFTADVREVQVLN